MINQSDIAAAAARIAAHIRRTPVISIDAAQIGVDHDTPLSLKLECLQHAGSFKPRGAFNTLLSQTAPAVGVAAASGGNHGAAVAYAARTLGLRARIFVPEISSPVKIARISANGADLVVGGARYADAAAACDVYVRDSGALPVHPYDTDETLAGQGTVAMEWETQAQALDTVLVAVGGGGLIAGMARWFERRIKVVGVEPEGSRCLQAALAAGAPVDVPVESIAADSLGAKRAGERVFAIAQRFVDRVVTVPDAAIRTAQSRLWNSVRVATEPGGATALAALLAGAYRPQPGERVGVLVCGANVDLADLSGVAAHPDNA